MKLSTIAIAAGAALVLAACSSSGSRHSSPNVSRAATSMFATGPIYSACMQSGRKQASRSKCGCVQAVANRSLTPDDQRRGSGFFSNPHQAQEVRTSDRSKDERFWLRWKAYGDSAAQMCS